MANDFYEHDEYILVDDENTRRKRKTKELKKKRKNRKEKI